MSVLALAAAAERLCTRAFKHGRGDITSASERERREGARTGHLSHCPGRMHPTLHHVNNHALTLITGALRQRREECG